MIKRSILTQFQKYLDKYPVLALVGPRQAGKTTFLKKHFPNYKYVSLEDADIKEYAQRDTRAFLKEYNDKVILDEAQQVPEIFNYLLNILDESGKMGQYILSGSQNFLLMERITQSLAGRVGLFKIFPMDFRELQHDKLLHADPVKAAIKGFYPAIYSREIDPNKYYSDYIETYINRDVSQLKNIHDKHVFKNFVKLCASRSGQLLNMNELARDAGISHTNVKNWISILETSYIVFLLHPYHKNFNKRVIKSPKLYFYDTGIVCHLLGINEKLSVRSLPFWGSIFENMIIAELEKQNQHNLLMRQYYFWRDSNKLEIDLLYEDADSMHLFEVKASSTISKNMWQGFEFFNQFLNEKKVENTLIYGGDQNQKRTNFNVKSWKSIE